MKSRPSVRKSKLSSRSLREVLLRTLSILAQERRLFLISSSRRNRLNSKKTKRSTSSAFRILPLETDSPIRRRFWRRRNNWQMVFTWLISSSLRSKTKLLMRRSKKETKSFTNLEKRSPQLLWFCLIPERSCNTFKSRTVTEMTN